MSEFIISAGIDVGTTTTHLTISRLTLQNTSIANRAPRMAVTAREIIYQSPVYFTPLDDDGAIDARAVCDLLSREYLRAGFAPEQIQTGALIVTGESARKGNAREFALALSELAGDFVVASAGWHLESVLAGRGSGAADASRIEAKTICNIDIGGGTCNYAVFKNGELLDTACLEIGGRCIQFEEDGSLKSYTDSGETFLDGVSKLKSLPLGVAGDPELLDLVAALLSEIILYVARTPTPPPVVQRLLQSDALRHNYEIDEYWISGGVAECMRNAETGRSHETAGCGESAGNAASALWQFGDFGVLLAHGLRAALAERNLNYKIADVGIRATVIGAGMHALQLSGFTVEVSDNVLPLRNVQIVQPFRPGDTALEENEIAAKIQILLERGELNNDELPVAISICDISSLPYTKLQAWARALVAAHRRHRSSQPLIVLSQEDIGLALGQTIKIYAPEIDLVILDGVDTSLGDFIDIGSILANKNAVPLTVKSLIFNN